MSIRSVDKILWTASGCVIPSRKTEAGRTIYGHFPIELPEFNLAPTSFLRQALEHLSFPVQVSVLGPIRRALDALRLDEEAIRILNSSPQKLDSSDLRSLFAKIDSASEGWGKKSLADTRRHARKPYFECPVRLSDGNLPKKCGFRTAAPGKRRPRKALKIGTAAELQDYQRPEGEPTIPMLDALQFNSLQERNSAAHAAGLKAQTDLLSSIESTFDLHQKWVERIRLLKTNGLSNDIPRRIRTTLEAGGSPKPKALKKLPEEIQLSILLYITERDGLHQGNPSRSESKSFPIAIAELSELSPLLPKKTARYAREALLADYYLPRHVVTAAMLAIQAETWLNTETIVSMTSSSLRKTKRGYEFTGLKGRTDQFQNGLIRNERDGQPPSFESKAAVAAIDMLLENIGKIERYLGKTDLPVLSSLSLLFKTGKHSFSVTNPLTAIAEFCQLHGRASFDTRFLRNLGVQVDYLSPEGSIFRAQVTLGHAELATTEDYLRTNVIHFLHQANIRRYMDMLAASILWRTGRTGLLEKHGLHTRNFKLDLLFPLDDAAPSESNSVIERWIESSGKAEIAIGLDEMEQCALQHQHYLREIHNLTQNRLAFIRMHIPRILCCVAMRQIFLTSTHASLYKKIEETFNE